jgi:DNA/RNA-binding domain of Phe-tRNA-synthetase-like protein
MAVSDETGSRQPALSESLKVVNKESQNLYVDGLNLSSRRFQLPFGLYDLGRIEPPAVLRKGSAGESGGREAARQVA